MNCKICMYSKPVGGGFFCRRYPPTVIGLTPGDATERYPLVGENDWCGEFKDPFKPIPEAQNNG